ncbi:MAG: hypothetical protein NC203_08840 [Firmicutes bacterium]|nr:hypothetical protein [[Eubacterium] siraeum]MCM1488459.1 hypothetical protein [Bacillota bacterium]
MKEKLKNSSILKNLPVIIVFIAIITIAAIAINNVEKSTEKESLSITENSIRRAVITCYAQEGRYPESIEYLAENYDLHVSDDFDVYYNIFAENIMPDIRVVRKQVSD